MSLALAAYSPVDRTSIWEQNSDLKKDDAHANLEVKFNISAKPV